MLNKGCQCSCNNNPPILVKKKSSTVKKNTPVVTQNTVVDEEFIEEEETEVPVTKTRGKCIMQHRPVMCELKRKQRKQKVRNRIETAIEKHESNRCNCH